MPRWALRSAVRRPSRWAVHWAARRASRRSIRATNGSREAESARPVWACDRRTTHRLLRAVVGSVCANGRRSVRPEALTHAREHALGPRLRQPVGSLRRPSPRGPSHGHGGRRQRPRQAARARRDSAWRGGRRRRHRHCRRACVQVAHCRSGGKKAVLSNRANGSVRGKACNGSRRRGCAQRGAHATSHVRSWRDHDLGRPRTGRGDGRSGARVPLPLPHAAAEGRSEAQTPTTRLLGRLVIVVVVGQLRWRRLERSIGGVGLGAPRAPTQRRGEVAGEATAVASTRWCRHVESGGEPGTGLA